MTAIAYSKPEDPIEFTKELLHHLKAARDSNSPVLICFTEANIKSMFTVLDPFEKGLIVRAQLEGALANFGVDPILLGQIIGDENRNFNVDNFSKMIIDGLRQTLFPQEISHSHSVPFGALQRRSPHISLVVTLTRPRLIQSSLFCSQSSGMSSIGTFTCSFISFAFIPH
jgi:hypothetical protein